MRIMHRLTIGKQQGPLLAALNDAGLPVEQPAGGIGPVFIDISEQDSRWGMVQEAIKALSVGYFADDIWTEFTEPERAQATFLKLGTCWTSGYPQPEELPVPGACYLPFEAETYDLTLHCPACGCGKKQRAPFQMKREPSWGRRAIMKLNWVNDEVFVRMDVWEALFKPLGVDGKQVLHYRTKSPLKTVVQLVINKLVRLEETKGQGTLCAVCGRLKYPPLSRGFFPAPVNVNGPIAKSEEYFGAHVMAFREILVSGGLYRQLSVAGVKGADFLPCRERM